MNDLCTYMLSWFMTMYENEERPMSPEVYDRAVFVIGIGVPMFLYVCVLIFFVLGMMAAFDFSRGKRK